MPATSPFGNGPCSGTFGGAWSGSLSGVYGSSPFTVAWSTSASGVSASFSFYELQCLDGVETALGVASGTGTANAGPGQVQGKWQNVAEPFPRDITGVSASFSFTWTRVGNGAVMSFSPMGISLSVAGMSAVQVVSAPQTGSAVFVPLTTGTGVPTCSNQWSNVTGQIAGEISISG